MSKRHEPSEKEQNSNLSPWQQENLEFLQKDDKENNSEENDELQETDAQKLVVQNEKTDIFAHSNKKHEIPKIKRYLKPTEIEIDDDEFLTELNNSIEELEETKESEEDDDKVVAEDESESKESSNDECEEIYEKARLERLKSFFVEKKENYLNSSFYHWYKQLSTKTKWQGFPLLVFLSAIVLFFLYYVSPLAFINNVEVIGNKMVTKADLKEVTKLSHNQRFWYQYYHQKQLLTEIRQYYPSVKNVKMSISRFNNITLKIEEYPITGYYQLDKVHYFPVLSNGVIVKDSESTNGNKLLFTNFQAGDVLTEVIKQYETLSKKTQKEITMITYNPTDANDMQVKLYMKDGNQVIISANDFSNMKYYNQVSKAFKKKGVIDMEAGIYAYPYGNEQSKNNEGNRYINGVNGWQTSSSRQEVVIPTN